MELDWGSSHHRAPPHILLLLLLFLLQVLSIKLLHLEHDGDMAHLHIASTCPPSHQVVLPQPLLPLEGREVIEEVVASRQREPPLHTASD